MLLPKPNAGCGCASARGSAASEYSQPSSYSSSDWTPTGSTTQRSIGYGPKPGNTFVERAAARSAAVKPPVCYANVEGVTIAVDCRILGR